MRSLIWIHLGSPSFGAEDLRHALEMRGARVERLVNAMADAHDLFLLRQAFGDVGVHLVERADFLEHFDDALVGAAVQRAFERADGAGDGGIHVAQRGDGDAGAEGGGVHAVVGMQHVAQVQRCSFSADGFSPSIRYRKFAASPSEGSGSSRLLALPDAMKIGGDDGNSRDEPDGLLPLRVHGIVVAVRVEAAQGGNSRADGVHRRRVLGQRLDDFDDAGGQFARGGQALLELRAVPCGWADGCGAADERLPRRSPCPRVRQCHSRNRSVCRRRPGHRSTGCWRRRHLQDLWREWGWDSDRD